MGNTIQSNEEDIGELSRTYEFFGETVDQ